MDDNSLDSGHDTRITKRRRVTVACNFCRTKKIKCDGAEPKCSTCNLYGAHLLRHQATTEFLLGYLLSQVSDIEGSIKRALECLEADSRADHDRYQGVWRNSPLCQSFGELVAEQTSVVSLGLETSQSNLDRPTDDMGKAQEIQTSRENRSSLATSPTLQGNTPALTYRPTREDPSVALTLGFTSQSLPLDSCPLPNLQNSLPDIEGLDRDNLLPAKRIPFPLLHSKEDGGPDIEIILFLSSLLRNSVPPDNEAFPDNGAALLRHYFTNIHSVIPLLDKIDLLQFFHNGRNAATDQQQSPLSREKLAIIWSSFALAHKDPQNDIRLRSYTYVAELVSLSRVDLECSASRIQSLILFILNLLHDRSWVAAREVVTVLCDWAIRRKLFDSTRPLHGGDNSVAWGTKHQERAWTACFLLDTLLASKLGLLPSLRSQNCSIPSIQEDDWEEWDTWAFPGEQMSQKAPARIASTYNQLIRLVYIFNTYLSSATLYHSSPDSGSDSDRVSTALSAYRSLCISFKGWSCDLPDHLKDLMIWDINDHPSVDYPKDSAPYTLSLNLAYHSFISFSCHKTLSFNGTLTKQTPQASVMDAASHRLATSSSCIDRLLQIHSAQYGIEFSNPLLDLILELVRQPEEWTSGQQDKQVFSENIEQSLFSFAGQNQKTRSQSKTQSSVHYDTTKVDEDRAIDSLDVVGGPSVEGEASELTTNTTGVELGTPTTSGLDMDSTEDMSNSNFEGSADLTSLGLLDYMDEPEQFMDFIDKLGFVRPGPGVRYSSANEPLDAVSTNPTDPDPSTQPEANIGILQDLLDDWITRASDP
ncbi:Quinic acid utilization activator [Fusarium acutatum]|uniref:Quinic acid utilization activator n=1 Tax=Fusarium acutatum TaxID=78861 RepID=A0A8H4JC70_9HYPO|nr:Quinic acid utilization activator [Fusarium acutatum]